MSNTNVSICAARYGDDCGRRADIPLPHIRRFLCKDAEEAHRREIGFVHPGVHGKAEVMVPACEPGCKAVEAIECASRFVSQEKFKPVSSNIYANRRESSRRGDRRFRSIVDYSGGRRPPALASAPAQCDARHEEHEDDSWYKLHTFRVAQRFSSGDGAVTDKTESSMQLERHAIAAQLERFVGCRLSGSRPSAHSIPQIDNAGPQHDPGSVGNQISQATVTVTADALRQFH